MDNFSLSVRHILNKPHSVQRPVIQCGTQPLTEDSRGRCLNTISFLILCRKAEILLHRVFRTVLSSSLEMTKKCY